MPDTPAAPSGLVTFLFTDIEGSTKLFHAQGEVYLRLLDDHHALIRAAIATHGGYEVKTEGDAFFVAFSDAVAAVNACADAQRALESHAWPVDARIKVRMGLHTAEATAVDGDYVSIAVHQVARISAGPHGGQVIMSDATADLVRPHLDGLELHDLGRYRLKDFDEPQALFELRGPGLPSGFPALRVPPAALHNLPRQRTSFVGRQQQVAEILQAVPQNCLVTLVATGGAGKTRLAIEAAGKLVPHFDHGVWFVDLASITEPGLVPGAVASALGVAETADQSPTESVLEHLHSQSSLLVLDNCEQVLDAVGDLVDEILATAPGVHVLATSREALQVRGEQLWPLRPLSTPDGTSLEEVLGSDSAQLFLDRVGLVRPQWQAQEEDTENLAALCQALDGVPLAIELAAAQMATMALSGLVEGLSRRLDMLVGGARGDAPRQRNLRALIAWSYELLGEVERTVFRNLAVFRGGFDRDAAIAVAGGGLIGDEVVFAALSTLIGKSLLEVDLDDDLNPRYRLLASIAAFADEVLELSGDRDGRRSRHLAWVLDLLDIAGSASGTAAHKDALDRLEREHDNIRAAQDHANLVDPATALSVAYGAADFRFIRGHMQEGRSALRAALDLDVVSDPRARALAQSVLGKNLCQNLAVGGEGRELLRQALETFEQQEDLPGAAFCLMALGEDLRLSLDEDEADDCLQRARQLARETGDERSEAMATSRLAQLTFDRGSRGAGCALAQEAVALAERSGDLRVRGIALHALATFERVLGQLQESYVHAVASVECFTRLGDRRGQGLAEMVVGAAARLLGQDSVAKEHLAASLQHCQAVRGVSWFYEILFEVAVLEVRHERRTAAVLLGAFLTHVGTNVLEAEMDAELEAATADILATLGDEGAGLMSSGKSLVFDEAVALASSTCLSP